MRMFANLAALVLAGLAVTTAEAAGPGVGGQGVPATSTPTATAPAQTPTATPTPTVVVLSLDFPLGIAEPRITWEPADAASTYRLTGELWASPANAGDPFCSPPHTQGVGLITLQLDETLAATTTEFLLPLPPLAPGDEWYFQFTDVFLFALDDSGSEIAQGGGLGIDDSGLFIRCPTPRLPATGAGNGPARAAGDASTLVGAVLTLALAALVGAAVIAAKNSRRGAG